MKLPKCFQCLSIFTATFFLSATASAEEYETQASHVHGVASLFIVQEGNELEVELTSPAMNLLGFEHSPGNEQQRRQVSRVSAQLHNVNQVVVFSGGQCQLLEVDIEMPAMDVDHHTDHADHSESGHSDVEVEYEFSCQKPETITALEVKLFEQFPALEEVDVQWIVNGQQGGKTLSPSDSRLELQ